MNNQHHKKKRNSDFRRRNDEEYSEIVEEFETRDSRRVRAWESNKYFYAFAYFLFFIPLFLEDTRRSRFYVNQGIMVWQWLILGNVALYYIGFIPGMEMFNPTAQWIFSGIIIFLALYGFIATLMDRRDVRLPLSVGSILSNNKEQPLVALFERTFYHGKGRGEASPLFYYNVTLKQTC